MLSQGLDTESGRELLRLRGRNILLIEERDALRHESDALRHERDALRHEREKDALRQERDALWQERERDALRHERDTLRQERDALLSSISWRVTEPLRRARRVVKKLFHRKNVEQSGEKSHDFLSKSLVEIAEPDVFASEVTMADTSPVSGTSGRMDSVPLSDDTPDKASAAKAAEPHSCPSGLALEALCWKAGCSPVNLLEGEGPRVSVWVAKRGNYFFHDIARLIHAGFQDMGVESKLTIAASEEDCLDPVHLNIPLRIVVAPHEFFLFIPEAAAWPLKGERLWFVNTEQAGLDWFAKGAKYFGRADLILDFDQDNVRHLLEAGFPAQYLPLGFSDFCSDFNGTATLPLSVATEGLPKATREWQAGEDPCSELLSARPLDCCFFGAATPRRSEFFARNAVLFAEIDSYLRLEDMFRPLFRPLISGETTPLDTTTACSIVRRSKIALNLHQSDTLYFEWHRIALLGMWQGAVVVSEPCSASWPLQPERDYIVAGLADMPAVRGYLLRSPAGREKAEKIRRSALQTLRRHSMGVILKRITGEYALGSGKGNHA